MKEFNVEIVEQPTATIVRLTGDCGIPASEQLEKVFMKISAKRPALLVLDLSELEFIASIGMGSIMRVQHDIVRAGGKVRLAGTQPAVWGVFKRCRLDGIFQAFDTVDAATAASV